MSINPPESEVNPKQEPLNPVNPQYSLDLRRILTTSEIRHYLQLLPQALQKEKRLQAEYLIKDKPLGWQTTDPQNHDPDNFRYIVHAIINTGDNDYIASLQRRPEKTHRMRKWMSLAGFLSREMISCTLIDEVHRGTYHQRRAVFHGFVLNVPEENIVAIAPGDMIKPGGQTQQGEQIYTRQEREQHVTVKPGIELKRNTPSAQDFFNREVNRSYNEVVVDGIGPNGKQITIGAIFLIVDPVLGTPLYDLYTRFSRNPKEIYNRVVSPVFIPKLGSEIRWDMMEMRKCYQEAKTLAQLLHVPIVHIPALFEAE